MKTRLALFSFLAACMIFFAGCFSASKLNDVKIGMTKDQVISIMGKPDSTSAQGSIEYMTYFLINDTAQGTDQPYSVRLVNNQVESYGRFTQLFDIYNRPVNGAPSPILGPGIGAPAQAVTPPANSIAMELQRLKVLHDQGVLSDDEFQRAKTKLLNQ